MSTSITKTGFVLVTATGAVILIVLCISLYQFSAFSNSFLVSYEIFKHKYYRKNNSYYYSTDQKLTPRYEVLAKAKDQTNTAKIDFCHTLNSDILQRGKYQQQKIHELCSQNNYTSINIPLTHSTFTSNIVYNVNYKLLGCGAEGNLISSSVFRLLEEKLVQQASTDENNKRNTLKPLLRNLQLRTKLRTYYRFSFVQNPVERLVAEYQRIYNTTNNHISTSTHLPAATFSEFLEHLLNIPTKDWEKRYAPTFYLCQPCQVLYDFYTSSETIEYDLQAILKVNGVPEKIILAIYESLPHPLTVKIDWKKYYIGLSESLKMKLLKKLSYEFEYYYSLYPNETDMHTTITQL